MAPCCNPPPLLVVGASARAMAQSGRRAGIPVHAADLFRDADLHEACASSIRVERYPEGLVDAVQALPGAAWCYVGGLENRPDLLEAIAAGRPLAGSPAPAVRLVRDPGWLAARCVEVGFAMPATHSSPAGIPPDGSHLAKPLDGAGGHGIRRWTGGGVSERPRVWQRWIAGTPHSAACLAANGGVELLFTSRQLVGWPPSHGGEFAWCGGITRRLPNEMAAALERLGRHVATAAGLRGLFGIDFMITPEGGMHPLEVNPRPTASMELWERSGAGSLVASHLAACGLGDASPPSPADPRAPVHGKAVLFATHPVIVATAAFDRWMRWRDDWRDRDGHPAVADIPAPGTPIARGGPVLTVFAAGRDEAAVLTRLERRLADVERSLGPHASTPATVSPPSAATGASAPQGRDTP